MAKFSYISLVLLHAAAALARPNASPNAQPAHRRAADATSTSSVDLINTFTSNATLPGLASTVSSAADIVIATGEFTGADNGVYGVTSVSGYVIIDGKTLTPGESALIGEEIVSDGSSAVVANGATVALVTTTITPAAAATSSTASATSSSATSATTGSGSASAASATASSSTSAAAAPMQTLVGQLAVAAGGLLGLMVL